MPSFIKRGGDDLLTRFNVPLGEYPRRCESQIGGWEALRRTSAELEVRRSVEYGSLIIHSRVTGQPRVVYGNMMNSHSSFPAGALQGGGAGKLISHLPDGCCVEVPCLVDRQGVQPTRIGQLPPQLAALMPTNINVQSLTVAALVSGNREHVYHAAMLDPHASAELDLDQIWGLVDELLAAHTGWLPEALQAAD